MAESQEVQDAVVRVLGDLVGKRARGGPRERLLERAAEDLKAVYPWSERVALQVDEEEAD